MAEEQWNEVIWGPCRISEGLGNTDRNGRAHGPFPLPGNESYMIPLEHTRMPSWQADWQRWRSRYQGKPVRLEITCIRDGHEPWILMPEVKVHFPPELMMQGPRP
jgi:hypothetical protein